MNLVIAAVLLTVVFVGFGLPGPSTTVATVSDCVVPADEGNRECRATDPESPAAQAGIRPGDTVVELAGEPVTGWSDLEETIRAQGGERIPVVVERDGERVELTVTPMRTERPVLGPDGAYVLDADGELATEPAGFLGVGPTNALIRQPMSAVPGELADRVGQTVVVVLNLPSRIADVAEAAFGTAPRDPAGVIGVVGVGRIAGEVAAEGDNPLGVAWQVLVFLELLASLNIALFVFNLIPILPLDGGHVAGALYEGARRQVARVRGLPRPRPVDIARMVPLTLGVVVVFFGMGALLVYADLVRPVTLGG
jgi:membrane-associated protease RseP (regulator of RpoE activity)